MKEDKLFIETVENLKRLDENSLKVIKNGTYFLKAKCELENDKKEKSKTDCEVM